ncbi:TIGR01777 family protein [Pseudonocardia zijingensis]|uniref:TIGR01777 family protein n=1 Tax=Pseudonocardia zijingensis TaxID=153376 RepID=UPI0036141998
MGIRWSAVVDAPLEEVFAWHARPGALLRLMPPWQPLGVVAEAESLRDGRAVLQVPPGLRWVAAHDPAAYDPPHRFVDELAGDPPLTWLLSWRHTHEFRAEGPASTRITDTVETQVPATLLRPVLAYRQAQLAGDLAVHARSRQWRAEPLTVAITGTDGPVGTPVAALLSTGGHRVVHLVPRAPRTDGERRWDPDAPAEDLLAGVDAVIHLATGRASATRRLAARAAEAGVGAYVAASSVGGSRREDAVAPAAAAGVRCVLVRTAAVLGPRGLPRPGRGGRWVPWIGVDDLADVYLRAACDAGLSGPVDAVTPHPVRLPLPVAGPCVGPDRLLAVGHRFRHPEIGSALRHVLGR